MLLRWDNQVSQLYILDNNGRFYAYDFYNRERQDTLSNRNATRLLKTHRIDRI